MTINYTNKFIRIIINMLTVSLKASFSYRKNRTTNRLVEILSNMKSDNTIDIKISETHQQIEWTDDDGLVLKSIYSDITKVFMDKSKAIYCFDTVFFIARDSETLEHYTFLFNIHIDIKNLTERNVSRMVLAMAMRFNRIYLAILHGKESAIKYLEQQENSIFSN